MARRGHVFLHDGLRVLGRAGGRPDANRRGEATRSDDVRVVHKPPKGRDWPGFYFYGSDKIAFEFGFVCDTIVSD
jgi:hypothetical protein